MGSQPHPLQLVRHSAEEAVAVGPNLHNPQPEHRQLPLQGLVLLGLPWLGGLGLRLGLWLGLRLGRRGGAAIASQLEPMHAGRCSTIWAYALQFRGGCPLRGGC